MDKKIFNKNVVALMKGDKGDSATIQVGEVKTLSPGSPATVTNKGTANAAVFEFGIPKGDGLAVKKWYASTEEMNADFNNAELSIGDIVGIDNTLEIYMKGETEFISKGSIKGASGTPGAPGAAATISIGTVTTGDAGSQASVTNVGSVNAAILNFSIPKGDKGDKGDTGDNGVSITGATLTEITA